MKKFLIASASFLPALSVFAGAGTVPVGTTVVNTGSLTTVSQVIERFQAVINIVIPFIIGLAVLMIIYGIFGFVTTPADGEARGQAKGYIIWGIIAVFIMVSIWGLVNILVNSFSTDQAAGQANATNTTIPQVGSGTAF